MTHKDDPLGAGKHSVLGIIASILDGLAETPLKIADLAFEANLDSSTTSKYVGIMLELELVDKSEGDPACFIITQKGRDFLEAYKPVHTF